LAGKTLSVGFACALSSAAFSAIAAAGGAGVLASAIGLAIALVTGPAGGCATGFADPRITSGCFIQRIAGIAEGLSGSAM
jgi:hypothetical protein